MLLRILHILFFLAPVSTLQAQTIFADSTGKKISFGELQRVPGMVHIIIVNDDIVKAPVVINFPHLKELIIKKDKGNTFLNALDVLPELEKLNIEFADGDSVPDLIWNYASLKSLTLSNATDRSFGEGLNKLNYLEEFRLLNCYLLKDFAVKPKGLPQLKVFEISNNLIDGKIILPDAFFELEQLQHLKLHGNKLNTNFLKNIYHLERLKHLDISNNNLRKIPVSVFQLQQLEILNLENNHLVEIPDEISSLSNLRILDISHNKNLKKLPSTLGELKNLEVLNLVHNSSLIKLPSSTANLISLKSILLYQCLKLDYATAFTYLKGCVLLDSLSISIKNRLPSTWSELKAVRSLVFHAGSADFDWSSIDKLSSSTQLERLEIYAPKVNIVALCKAISDLPVISLSLTNCGLTIIPSEIKNLKSLEVLLLSKNKIAEIHENVGQLSKLKYLDLQSQKEEILAKSERETAVYYLKTLPAGITGLKSLKNLLLFGNDFNPEIVNALQQQMPWCKIDY